MNKKRIVITGLGPIASPGIGKKALWEGVCEQKIGLELVSAKIGDDKWEEFYMHKVKNFDIQNFNFDRYDLNYITNWKEGKQNQDLLLFLAATRLALEDGNINYKNQNNSLGLIVTHENPCLEQLLWEIFNESYSLLISDIKLGKNEYFSRLFVNNVKTAYETQSFMLLFHVARMFNIHKFSVCMNNACASGLYALEMASDMIRLEKVSKVVIVAGDCPDVFKFLWFKMIGMYEVDGQIKPFSKKAKGFVFGEGATAIVVEDYESAINRNVKIYAEYLGGGFRLDSWKVLVPDVTKHYLRDAINDAIQVSNIDREDVDLVCAHGAGTRIGDNYEAQAILDVFKNIRNVPFTALKPYVGHNLGGSTLIELAILLLSMEENCLIPIKNINIKDLCLDINVVQNKKNAKLNTVLKTCSAFAGYHAAVILKKLRK
jgi:3-oxoacyl-(acyl-carrier-protein) synthase